MGEKENCDSVKASCCSLLKTVPPPNVTLFKYPLVAYFMEKANNSKPECTGFAPGKTLQ